MEGFVKKSIVFVPAWWPCSFFEEQQQVYANKYGVVNIIGGVRFLCYKKSLSYYCRPVVTTENSAGGAYRIAINWLNGKWKRWQDKRFETTVNMVGNCITNCLGGTMPQAVHIQSLSDLSVFVAYWAVRNGIPLTVTEHVLYIRRQFDYFTQKKERIYQFADKVYCVSNYLLSNLLTNGFVIKKTKVIGNLIKTPDNFSIIGQDKRNGRVMFVAGHLSDKNVPLLLDVAEMLQHHNTDIDIFGLNGKEQLNNKRTLAQELDVRALKNIHLQGNISHANLLERYKNYSVLISTSISETFGLSVAEAISNGVPVVCSNSGGVCEFVNQSNGLIVEIGNRQALADAVLQVMQTSYDVNAISREILAKYGYEAYAKQLSD